MKKIFLSLLMLIMVVSLCACSKEDKKDSEKDSKEQENISETQVADKNTQSDSKNNNTSANNETSEIENITLEDVMNHPVTPESDFMVVTLDDGTCEIVSYTGNDNILVIPETIDGMKVVGIRHKSFYRDKNIVGLKLSDTIEYVDYEAFRMAKQLKFVVCGTNLKKISEAAFFDCPNLSEVKLNEGIEFLGVGAFSATELKSIYIPQSATEIMSFVKMNEDFTIQGVSGSKAESYAAEKGFKFEAVN